jgi:LAGLIDADG endonuclease
MNLQAQWILGFVDGEGCFHVSIVYNQTTALKYQVISEFTIVQHEKDIQVLYALKSYFGCGIVKKINGDHYCYCVKSYKHLYENILPFFEKHKLKTKKRIDFEKFRFVVRFVTQGQHNTQDGLKELQKFVSQWVKQKKGHNI